jgi:hypothetical protein
LTLPLVGGLEVGGTYRVEAQTTEVALLTYDRLELVVVTRVATAEDAHPVTSTDTFEVANVDRVTISRLKTRRPAGGEPRAGGSDSEGAGLADGNPRMEERGLVLRTTSGSGTDANLGPAHMSRAGARLMGHDRPFLQHLCVLNLVHSRHGRC